jgi:hypothetical protein
LGIIDLHAPTWGGVSTSYLHINAISAHSIYNSLSSY